MILFILGSVVGIALMCLLQVNKENRYDTKVKELISYLDMYIQTNARHIKDDYDKGYVNGLEYATLAIKEELQ